MPREGFWKLNSVIICVPLTQIECTGKMEWKIGRAIRQRKSHNLKNNCICSGQNTPVDLNDLVLHRKLKNETPERYTNMGYSFRKDFKQKSRITFPSLAVFLKYSELDFAISPGRVVVDAVSVVAIARCMVLHFCSCCSAAAMYY